MNTILLSRVTGIVQVDEDARVRLRPACFRLEDLFLARGKLRSIWDAEGAGVLLSSFDRINARGVRCLLQLRRRASLEQRASAGPSLPHCASARRPVARHNRSRVAS